MFIGPKPTAPASKTRTIFISALILFLVLTVWNHHERLTLEVVNVLGDQVMGLPEKEDGIPKKIWYKLGPKGLSDEMKEWTGSCLNQNPEYDHEFLTDKSAEEYVIKTFSDSRPDIVEIYTQLTIPILKADLVRYLLLYTEGGIWSDLDVSCEGIPISEWIPEPYHSNTGIDLIVGYEFDAGYSDYYFHEFATWTILSKPNVSHMLVVIDDIIDAVHAARAQNEVPSIADLTPPMVGDIVDFTGPRRFTRSIMRSLAEQMGVEIDRHDVENIVDPLLLSNVLILPGNAFANLTNHFEDSDPSSMPELVTHHYAGSWKNDYGGEQVGDEKVVGGTDEPAAPDAGSEKT